MVVTPIRDLIAGASDSQILKLKEALLKFRCCRDDDVQGFLRFNAILYDCTNRAKTYLCFSDKIELLAYFTLSVTAIEYSQAVSDKVKRKFNYGRTTCRNEMVWCR